MKNCCVQQRISLRDRIFREVVGNLLIHREFSNAFPAKLIIEKDRILSENWNRPHDGGVIDPTNFSPYPKNPVIAKFFKEIGRVDELGSGVRTTFKYCGIYTPGTNPEFIEDDVFKTIIPLKAKDVKEPVLASGWDEVRRTIRRKFGEKFGGSSEKIVALIFGNQHITTSEMAELIGITERAIEKQLAKLKEKTIIDRVGPDKGGYWKINV